MCQDIRQFVMNDKQQLPTVENENRFQEGKRDCTLIIQVVCWMELAAPLPFLSAHSFDSASEEFYFIFYGCKVLSLMALITFQLRLYMADTVRKKIIIIAPILILKKQQNKQNKTQTILEFE